MPSTPFKYVKFGSPEKRYDQTLSKYNSLEKEVQKVQMRRSKLALRHAAAKRALMKKKSEFKTLNYQIGEIEGDLGMLATQIDAIDAEQRGLKKETQLWKRGVLEVSKVVLKAESSQAGVGEELDDASPEIDVIQDNED